MKSVQKNIEKKKSKISVGEDEFCSKCMEWRKYDEEGKCKVCGKIIKDTTRRIQDTQYDEYGIDSEPEESDFDGV